MARVITETWEGAHMYRFGNLVATFGTNSSIVTVGGSFGGFILDGARHLQMNGYDQFWTLPVPAQNEYYAGFFFNDRKPQHVFNANVFQSQSTGNHCLIGWGNTADLTLTGGMGLVRINPLTQFLELNIGAGRGVLAAVSTQAQPITGNTSYHLQVHAFIDPVNGIVQVKLDDVLVIDYSGPTGTGSITNFYLFSEGGSFADNAIDTGIERDALVVNDTTTAADNTWTGIRRFVVQNVTGPGTYAQFTPFGDAPNFNCIDDLPHDGDVTYNYALSSGLKDSFPCSPHGLDVAHTTFHAWFQEAIARKTSGTFKINLGVRRAGVDYYDAVSHDLGVSYDVYDSRRGSDPSSLVAWTGAGLDATEIIYRSI